MTTPRPATALPGPLPGPLVGADWLAGRLGEPGTVVFDASVGAHRGAGRRIPGARPFDLDGALSDHDAPAPHTMPGAAAFEDAIRALGVDDTDTVVVYDGAGVYSSARAWWMLRAMGFDRAAVLDGGLPAWTAAGLPVEECGPAYEGPRGSFTARPRTGLLVDAGAVRAALADPSAVVLDARTRGRFTGTAPEPRAGLRGGHMPGAVNLPFGDLQRDGLMRPAAELRAAFTALTGNRGRLYFSCGSGVTACVLALGATLAGYESLAVYDGSWTDWAMRPELPAVTGRRGQLFDGAASGDRFATPATGDERVLLTDFLAAQRATLELKCAGLEAELALRSVEPSTLSLLGLVRHLADMERRWFRRVLAGQHAPALFSSDADPDGDFDGAVSGPEAVATAWEAWRDEVAFAQSFTAAAPDLDVEADDEWRGKVSLRWVLIHMIEEYARHNGHADLLRERIDGAIGI